MCGHSLTLKVCKLFVTPQISYASEMDFFLGALLGYLGMSSAGTLGMPWGAASGGISQPWSEPLSQLPRGEEPPLDFLSGQTQRSFSLSTPELPGYFLSVSMSASRVTAKCFPTLPLPLLPFQHRGKYCAHTFHEYSLNDWMFVRGDQLPSCTLRVCCCYSISSLAAFLSPLSPFCWGYSTLGLMLMWEASAFSKSFVSHQAEHADNYQVECWLLFWIDMIFHPDFQPANKGTHGYLPRCYSLSFPFSVM